MYIDIQTVLEQVRSNTLKTISCIEDTGVYIDIGCQEPGSTPSLPTEKINKSKFSLLFEPNTHYFLQTKNYYKDHTNIIVESEFITPNNISKKIIEPLENAGLKDDVFLIDVDIDGYDFFVCDALLKNIRPTFLIVEINEKIPPPIKFTVLYNETYTGPKEHFYGSSICKMFELTKYDYDAIKLFFNTLIFVNKNKNPYYTDPDKFIAFKPVSPKELYYKGYLKDRLHELIDYNQNVKHWQTKHDPTDLINSINEYFLQYKDMFSIDY